jgi:aryl-alcohol dehydrogenase-like predicted oxidoreductase
MRKRRFGRLAWEVNRIGYGMWGIAGGEGGWTGADDRTGMQALQRGVDLGINFFDTAWIYGRGHSEEMLAELIRANPQTRLIVATKVPPRNRQWPSPRSTALDDAFPEAHIAEYVRRSLDNLQVDAIDLLQFHVWEDAWARDVRWQRAVERLRQDGLIRGVGISVNRWEPWNVLDTLRTGLVDAVQVIYNIFDQAPEDELFGVCEELDIAVVARVPFDEGGLTGMLSKESTWPKADWRHRYFGPENLPETVDRANRVAELLPDGMTLPELALRFVLHNPVVAAVIPGMRSVGHVEANASVSGLPPLPADLMQRLRQHRWDRVPTEWSD